MYKITKKIYKEKIPQKVLSLFSSKEKVKWIVKDYFDFSSLIYFIVVLWVNIEIVFPVLYQDYQILFCGLNFEKGLYSFISYNLIVFFMFFLLLQVVEYYFFTKIIITNKKLYINRFCHVIAIDKDNIDPFSIIKINLYIPFYSLIKTIDGKVYFFPSVSLSNDIYKGLNENDIVKRNLLEAKIKERIELEKEKKSKTIFGFSCQVYKKMASFPIVGNFIIFFTCLVPLIFIFYFISLCEYEFNQISLPAKLFKYNVIHKSLKAFDSQNFQDCKIAVLLREKLYENYQIVYNSFDDKKYNSIASFYLVVDEFNYYNGKQKRNYKNIKDKDKALENYIRQESIILSEISKILKEYSYKDEYYEANIQTSLNWRKVFPKDIEYSVPDRLTFYLILANFYIKNNSNLINVEEYKSILNSYDEILKQEKDKDSIMYRSIKEKRKAPYYNYLLNTFWGAYSYAILNSEIENNEENFCKNIEIFNKFSKVYVYSDKYKTMMKNIKKECNYEINNNYEEAVNKPKEYKNHFREVH